MASQGQYGQDLVDAVMEKDVKKVRKILKSGANLNYVRRGDTPIHLAARQGDLDIISALLRAGDSVNKGNTNGNTPLHFVARDGRDDLVRYLVNKGADINIQNEDGDTPLIASVGYLPMDLIEYYVGIGMDVNRQNKMGDTPLHVAVSHSRDESVEALLLSDADVNISNNQGKKAYQLARREGIADLIKTFDLLKAAKDSGYIMAEGTKLKYKDVESPKHLERVGITMEKMSLDPDPRSLVVFYCRREKYENNTVKFQTEPEEEVVSDIYHFRVRDVIDEITTSFKVPVYAEPSDKQQIVLKFLAGKGGMQIITSLVKEDEGIFCVVEAVLVPETTTVIVVCLCAKGQDQIVSEQAQQISSEVEEDFAMAIPEGAFQPDSVISIKVFDVNVNTDDNDDERGDREDATRQDIETQEQFDDEDDDDKENHRSKRKLRKRKAKTNLLSDLFQVNIAGEQPTKNVKLQLPFTDGCEQMDASDLQIVRVNDANNKDFAILPCETDEKGDIVNFETEHFCTFVICPKMSDIAKVIADIRNSKLRRQEALFFAMVQEAEDEVSHVLVVECIKSKLSSKRRKHWRRKGFSKQKPKHSSNVLLTPSQEFYIELTGDARFDTTCGETGRRKLMFSPHRASYQPYRITVPRFCKNGGKATVHIYTTANEDSASLYSTMSEGNESVYTTNNDDNESVYTTTNEDGDTESVAESEHSHMTALAKLEVASLRIKLPIPPEEDPFGTELEHVFNYVTERESARRKLRAVWWKMAEFLHETNKADLLQQQQWQQGAYLKKMARLTKEQAILRERRRVESARLERMRVEYPKDICR